MAGGAPLDTDTPASPAAPRSRPVTMREVAAVAGVSMSAVSYVLNNTRPVRADKRERVLKAIADLEYVPNGMARGLRRTRSGILGAILPDLSLHSYGLLAKHIEAAARDAGYMTILCNSAGDDDARASAYVRGLQGLRADGLLLRTTREQHELLPAVIQSRIPAVLMMSDPHSLGEHLDRVLIDNAFGVRLAVQELVAAGHRNIGLVSSPDMSKPTMVRLQGFLGGMEDAGLRADMGLVRIGTASAEAGERLAGELLDASRPPTALIVAHWRQSLGALRAVRAREIRIPEQLSVIVFGRRDYFDLFAPSLTVVELPLPEMAEQATRLLVERLDNGPGGERPPQQIVLRPSLHGGASVGPPR